MQHIHITKSTTVLGLWFAVVLAAFFIFISLNSSALADEQVPADEQAVMAEVGTVPEEILDVTEEVITEESVVEEVMTEAADATIEEPPPPEEQVEALVTPELSTDKNDYHPGETATIFGKFFSSLQSYVVKVFGSDENGDNYTETEESVTADGEGAFSLAYVLDALYRPFYEVVVSTLGGEKVAETWFRDSAIPIYNQCGNDDGDGYPGPDDGCHWLNGAINSSNSVYYEGDSTIHRTYMNGFEPGTSHTVTYKYGTTKGGHHAYDYLTTWSASEGWVTWADLCDGMTGCTSASSDTEPMENDPLVDDTIEPSPASRLFTMRGGTITDVSIPTVVSGDYTGDSETVVTVTFTTGATGTPMCTSDFVGPKNNQTEVVSCGVGIWFGAHIAKTSEWTTFNGTTGAGSINGSPYHVALASLDNVEQTQGGGRDNQMSADVLVVPPPAPEAHLTLVKQVTNNNGGTAVATDWTLSAAGITPISGQTGTAAVTNAFVSPGTYTLSETGGPAGYSASAWLCTGTGITQNGNQVTLDDQESATCTITNDDITPTLTVIKQLEPASDAGKFNLQIDGQTAGTGANVGDEGTTGAVAVIAGNHTVGETAGTGTTLSDYTAVISGDCAANGSVSLALGENKTCTITNTKKGTIVIVKDVIGNPDPTDFTFQNNFGNDNPTSFQLDEDNNGDLPNSRSFSVLPGTYSVSEDALAGWQNESATCNQGETIENIDVAAGETITCTFVNEELVSITLIKNTVGGNGDFDFDATGAGLPADIDLTTVNGTAQQTFTGLDQDNTYSITENIPAGWDLTSATCTGGNTPASITPEPGEDVTCTFTNTKRGKIIVVKQTLPDGDAQSFTFAASYDQDGFALSDGGQNDSGFIVPGNYSVSETVPAGWDQTSAVCSDGSGLNSIALAAGEIVTCTFVNTKRGEIVLIKNTVGGDGSFDFVHQIAGLDTTLTTIAETDSDTSDKLIPGDYSISETVPTGWDLTSATCDKDETIQNISVGAGETVTCTFVNTKRGHIVVDKVTDPAGDPQEFTFTSDYSENFTLTDTSAPHDSGALIPGSYSVSEIVPDGWEQVGAVCDDDDSTDPNVLTLDPGETIHCTFTNEKDAHIVVVKQTIPDGDPTAFDFDLSYGDGDADLADGGQDDSGDLDPGTYSVSENVPEGWDLTDITCESSLSHAADLDGKDIDLAAGEVVTCTFRNTKMGRIIVDKVTLPALDPQEFTFAASYDIDGFMLKGGDTNTSPWLLPDTYSVSEVQVEGWVLDERTCDDADGGDPGTINLAAGEIVHCVFTNIKNGQITLAKETVGGNGEFAFEGNIGATLSGGASTTEVVEPGTYTSTEIVPSGWALTSLLCDDENSIEDLENGTVTFKVEPGEHVTCTFTNTKLGKIITQKQTLPDGDATLFDFTASWDNGTDPDFALADGGEHDSDYLMPGAYALSEVVPTGWIQSNLSCTSSLQDTEAAANLELDAGEIITCVYENTKIQDLEVAKTANTSYTRTFGWDIEKTVTPAIWDLFAGESGTSEYTIALTKDDGTDSAHEVTGTITITNPNTNTSLDATIESVSDLLDDSGSATIDCTVDDAPTVFPIVLQENSQLVCTYTKSDASRDDTLNTATVVTSGLVPGGVGTAAVVWGEPSVLVDDTVSIDDTFADGDKSGITDDDTYTYTRTFMCGADEGVVENTATIVETNDSDDASVEVNCHEITVTKSAQTSYDLTYVWGIEKTGDQTTLTLSPGQEFVVHYDVEVDADDGTKSNFAGEGSITVHNGSPIDATLNSVVDAVSGVGAANVDCEVSFPYTLLAGQELVCTYDIALPNETTRTNTATAVRQNHDYDKEGVATEDGTTDVSGTAEVNFATASVNKIDECITVDDTFGEGPQDQVVCEKEAPKTYSYTHNVGPYEQAACGTTIDVDNTASFTANDSDATGSDTWEVDVTVACVCSLTQGYWKTHNDSFKGGAPTDDNWASLGALKELMGFFTTSNSAPVVGPNTPTHTWFKVFWTAPKGNAYYNLAHQYQAAKLNVLNGALPPAQVSGALTFAENFFTTYTPNNWPKNQKNALTTNAGILGAFNEGITNPAGHCTEIPQ